MSHFITYPKAFGLIGVCLCLLLSVCPSVSAETPVTAEGGKRTAENSAAVSSVADYQEYWDAHRSADRPVTEIVLPAAEGEIRNTGAQRKDGFLCLNTEGAVSWQFAVEKEGLYALEWQYLPLTENGSSIEIGLQLDGSLPFSQAQSLILPHRYHEETATYQTDSMGNDILPRSVETGKTLTWSTVDSEGYISGNLLFWLSAGPHTLQLSGVRESVALQSLRFYNEEAVPAYKTYASSHPQTAAKGDPVILEAEAAAEKTSTMLYPLVDRSSPATTPSDPICKKLNTIGGANWSTPNQELLWTVEVPADGCYTLSFRYKQNFLRGFFVSRTLKIDGKIPFAEMEAVRFDYGVSWQTVTLGGEEPYRFYLTKGTHTVSMTPTIGELSQIVTDASRAVSEMNTMYRRIVMVTGVDPDMFRDYYLQEAIPELMQQMTDCSKLLRRLEKQVYDLTKKEGTEAATLVRIAEQMEDFLAHPNSIPTRLSAFNDNIISLSAWVLSMQNQSLTLDKFAFSPEDSVPKAFSVPFASSVWYHMKAFFASFVVDYESVGQVDNTADRSVSVWVSTGRDQAEILKKMIDSDFVVHHGINVNMSLVQGGLMQAFMAGKAPDVALTMGRGDPINYALRGAVCALEDLPGFAELAAEFTDTAFQPYTLNGHVYAVPESEGFLMMFYRTDVFAELGLQAPKTWQEMLAVAERLQRSHMNIGLPYASLDAYSTVSQGIGSQNLFPTLLLQNGNGLYNEKRDATVLDTTLAIQAFKIWCDYYTQYNIPLYKDDFNRFRSGEMPLVITSYTFYNQLATAAAEIRNLWEMCLLPGTEKEDGTIDRTTASSGTASMILSSVKDREAAWEFVKWFDSAEVQGQYGIEIENVVGAAGRYNPANQKALSYLPWGVREYKLITEQWQSVVDLPEVAGGYYVSRNIDNAFKAVYYDNENYREALSYWNKQINREIERKRAEFNLDR